MSEPEPRPEPSPAPESAPAPSPYAESERPRERRSARTFAAAAVLTAGIAAMFLLKDARTPQAPSEPAPVAAPPVQAPAMPADIPIAIIPAAGIDAAPAQPDELVPYQEHAPAPPAALPQCTRCGDGAAAYSRDPISGGSGRSIGAAKFIGMCGGAYAYEVRNNSGSAIKATLTDRSGEAWDVDLPAGGSAIIKSGTPLAGGLTGRQR